MEIAISKSALDAYLPHLIRTEASDYYIDLVFYNVVLKCYVLIDLKIGKITHQDVGQMDMYIRMYDEGEEHLRFCRKELPQRF